MTNPHRGEVEFKAGGKSYVARLTVNALVEAENIGVDINDQAGLQKIGTMRSILWAALRDKHPDLSLEDVGNMMTEIGLTKAAEIVGAALKRAFPEASTTENPQ